MSKKILVIDDEADIRMYLSTLFQDNGYEVITANNGKEGFEKAVSDKPDLITLDITMPEESGVRAYRELLENESTQNTPIVVITGVSIDFKKFIETRKQVKPPVAYFEKPIDRDALLDKIKELI